jgi:hypothetical protein
MKNLLFLLLTATTLFSQEVRKEVDDFTNEVVFKVDKNLEFEEMTLEPHLRTFAKDKTHCFEILVKSRLKCAKSSQLIIVFEDGSNTFLKSVNNECSFFRLNSSAMKKLKTKKITKLKLTDTNTLESVVVVNQNSDYFIKLFEEITLKNIIGYQ